MSREVGVGGREGRATNDRTRSSETDDPAFFGWLTKPSFFYSIKSCKWAVDNSFPRVFFSRDLYKKKSCKCSQTPLPGPRA